MGVGRRTLQCPARVPKGTRLFLCSHNRSRGHLQTGAGCPLVQYDALQASELSQSLGRAPEAALISHAAGVSAPPLPSRGCSDSSMLGALPGHTPSALSCSLSPLYVPSRHVLPPPGLPLMDHLAQNASSMREETSPAHPGACSACGQA